MFYRMIAKKRDEWLAKDCPVAELIAYIDKQGKLRDAQVDAIKTYLYLKIACDNRPLAELFSKGVFNSLDLNELAIPMSTREVLKSTPSLAALYEYASLADESGSPLFPKVCQEILKDPKSVNAREFFNQVFYEVKYTDYLFSLPMGAGKTYLMAAFIYLDLYFAVNEPDNSAFAHNFMVFAPSGLKASVVPSLKTIQRFDPAWIIPEPAASELKRMLIFEVLDENSTAKKSNKIKNPNVQKIAIHQPYELMMGFVAVTNAEKVILNRLTFENGQIGIFDRETNDKEERAANELRHTIGKIPHLAVFIDEVHHAARDEVKLRAVVHRWTEGGNITGIIGFSGTPYLHTRERVNVMQDISISMQEISNITYYYPLVDGIGNFLKRPKVYISDSTDRLAITERGVRQFLDDFKNKLYPDGTCAKLAVYCGTIETLEEQIYPLVEKIVTEYGLNPALSILKFHDGNKTYAAPTDSAYEFSMLDSSLSQKRIVLLVQIGKEGWDCRSLTGVILSQQGDCPTNMVLQTSCRCLRQVEKGVVEPAMIYLNKNNAATLNAQLEQQHHIDLEEFQKGKATPFQELKRYDRTGYLHLPKVDFYQFKVNYRTVLVDKATNEGISAGIEAAADDAHIVTLLQTAVFSDSLQTTDVVEDETERGNIVANYNIWLNELLKESFGNITYQMLSPFYAQLQRAFEQITYFRDGVRYFSSHYDLAAFNARIRKAFYDKRSFETQDELIPEEAALFRVENFQPTIRTTKVDDYYPEQEIVERIVAEDKGKLKLSAKELRAIETFESIGYMDEADKIRAKAQPYPMKDKSFHYLPYHTDSEFEQVFLAEVLKLDVVRKNDLEVYYNGDEVFTEFRIKCYERKGGRYNYIGMYTPDFLVIQRKDGQIHKALIVETKGALYARDPVFTNKRHFTETDFLQRNNELFGYQKFDYLYLEDGLPEKERIVKTMHAIREFFTGE